MKLSKFTVVMAVLLMAILAIGAVSAESIGDSDDLAKDVSAVDTISEDTVSADDAVKNNLGSAVLTDGEDTPTDTPVDTPTDPISEENVYNITDDTYSTYFNEDGTTTEALSADGDYTLVIGALNNKDMVISSGSNINITSSEDGGIINNGTITIGQGDGLAGSIIVSGLTFTNTNKDAIVVNQYSTKVTIDENNFDLTYDDTYTGSPMVIVTYGYVDETTIVDNVINMTSAASYTYGIDLCYYLAGWTGYGDANAEHFYVANNEINIHSTAQSGMAEAMYLDTIINSEIVGNTINVVTDNAGVANYGMQVSDSWGFFNDPWAASPYNVTIDGNTLVLDSADLAYGISAISLWSFDEDYGTIVKDIVISNNDVTITTQTEGVGIGAQSSDVSITDNTVYLKAESEPVQAYVDSYLGNESYPIFVNNFNKDMGYYTNNTVTGNTITTQGIKAAKEDENVQPLVIENNHFIYEDINDDNYADFFNEDGTIKDGALSAGDVILLGNLTNKKLVIDTPLTVNAVPGKKLVNTTISLVAVADGTVIDGLDMDYEDDGSATFAIISVNDGVSNVVISDNTINAETAKSWNYNMGISVYGSEEGSENITISGNTLTMSGESGGLYGIDVQNYDPNWKKGQGTTGLNILDNTIEISGTGMVEPIYISNCGAIIVDGNNITSSSTGGDAYGIGTSTNGDFVISNNVIEVGSENNMAYGIASPDSSFVIIENNTINAAGVGAIGVGLVNDEDVVVDGNDISIIGGDFTTLSTYEKVGIGNAAILDKSGNTNLEIGENTIAVSGPKLITDGTYSQYFDEKGNIKDNSIAEGDTLLIDTLTNKNMVIDIPVEIKGMENNNLVNTTINLVAGADGTTIDGLNMEFTGDNTTGSKGLIYAKDVSDIAITNNNIVVPDFVDKTGAKYGSSVYAIEIESGAGGCDNVTITGNTIDITGTARYLYGIDVFKTWGSENKNSNLNISDNNVTINGGSRMAEAIYVSESDDVVIDDNTISSTSQGAAYGIATDQLVGSEIKGNDIEATSEGNMAYGITSTTNGANVTIEGNNVTATGVGAVGVGLSGQDNVAVNGNNIDITGGDFTSITSSDNLGTANAAILNKDETNTNLAVGENALTENGKATDIVVTGNGTKDLQNILDAAEAGDTIDLTGKYFQNVGTVAIDKDVAITGGTISGAEGKPIFEVAPKSENGPSEVNITGVDFKVNNANTIAKVTAENATDGVSIDVPAINIKDNNIELAGDDVVAESVTVLELESERPVLSPTSEIAVSGNTIAAGVDPFDFKVTSVASGDDINVTPQKIVPEKQATVIVYENMSTTAVGPTDGRTGEYFYFTLTDANGKPIPNTPMQIGFNGKVYDYEHNNISTDEKGVAKLQINLGYKGSYTFAICFLGNDDYNASFAVAVIKVDVQKPKLTAPNKSYAASAKTKTLTATFKTDKGNPIVGKSIKFTVNGKTYSAKTNDKGVATVKVSLNKKGTYNFTVKYGGDSTYAAVTQKAKLVIK